MILGIGTGDPIDEPEHRVFGIEYLDKAERREHLVETVRAIKALYAGVPWEGGPHVPAMTGPLVPPPVRPGGPPIWIGGFADAVVRLAAAEADAWNGWGMGLDEFTRKARLLRETAAGPAGRGDVGRDRRRRARRRGGRSPARTAERARHWSPGVWSGTTAALRTRLDELAARRRDMVGARARRSARPARRDRRRGPPARPVVRRERSPGPPAEAGQARAAPRGPRGTRRAPPRTSGRRAARRSPTGSSSSPRWPTPDGAGLLVVRQRGGHRAADRAPALARHDRRAAADRGRATSSPSSRRPARR